MRQRQSATFQRRAIRRVLRAGLVEIGPAEIGAGHAQILFDRQFCQHAVAFWYGSDAQAAHRFGALADDRFAVQRDLAAGDRQCPDDRKHERAFARYDRAR